MVASLELPDPPVPARHEPAAARGGARVAVGRLRWVAASHVHGLERDVEARVGAEVPVVVTARDVAPGAVIRAAALCGWLACPRGTRRPDGLASVAEAAGRRSATALPRGSYVTVSRLRDVRAERSPGALRRGERAVEVGVAGGAALAGAPPGSRVDVLVSSEPGGGGRAHGGGARVGGAAGIAPGRRGLASHAEGHAASGGVPHGGGELRARGAAAAPAPRESAAAPGPVAVGAGEL